VIAPRAFLDTLAEQGVRFVTGVPDSLLKPFCAAVASLEGSPMTHQVAASEGSAVAMAIGHHLATGLVPLVYMQNSGLGNAYNPLASLAHAEVYGIPLLLLIGWRGELLDAGDPGRQVADEPQHRVQGRITLQTLRALDIPFRILARDSNTDDDVRSLVAQARDGSRPVALVARKGSFASAPLLRPERNWPMSREQAIACILSGLGDAVFVSTTGKASREVFELRERQGGGHGADFLTVGGMGHAGQIACGIALAQPRRRVCCLDGDGALLMHMGGAAQSATLDNYVHVLLNNDAHDSVGGQAVAAGSADFVSIAKAVGYKSVRRISSPDELRAAMSDLGRDWRSAFVEVLVNRESRSDLGRPTANPKENKESLMRYLGSGSRA
jgi:phosphonopyruvate decarboxylase